MYLYTLSVKKKFPIVPNFFQKKNLEDKVNRELN